MPDNGDMAAHHTTHPAAAGERKVAMTSTTTHTYGGRAVGSELQGSTIVRRTMTAYELADGRFVGIASVDGLTFVEPMVSLGGQA